MKKKLFQKKRESKQNRPLYFCEKLINYDRETFTGLFCTTPRTSSVKVLANSWGEMSLRLEIIVDARKQEVKRFIYYSETY